MKKILLILILSLLFKANAQENAFVQYSVAISDEPIFKDNAIARNRFENAMKEAKKLKFSLLVNKSKSYFYNNPSLSFNETGGSRQSTLIFANYIGETYSGTDTLYQNIPLLGKNVYVKKPINSNWTLHNETKTIDGYECYKATTENVVINDVGEFRHPVIAWYCPEIPLPFGPNGYGGLPGLILQIQIRNVTYGVDSIEFNTEKSIEFQKNKMKIINEKELKVALDKFNGFGSN
jgi:GLPGLI family protein